MQQCPSTSPQEAAGGGYAAHEATFSPNAWHAIADVRNGIGIPEVEIDRLRREVRRTYRLSLDPTKAQDASFICGSEIDAVRRAWRKHRQQQGRLGGTA